MVTGQLSSTEGTDLETGDRLRSFLRRYSYAGVILGSLLALWWGYASPYPLEWVAVGVQITAIVTVLTLEFVIPFKPHWGDIRNMTRADGIYFLLAAPIDQLQTFLLIGLLSASAGYHQYIQVFDFWPHHWHVLAQLVLVILIVDFFKYWYHRWTHEVPLLWRMHSIHHCLDRLEMLRASYFYPLDIFITVAIGTAALLAFGVPYEIIIFHNVWAGITGLLNHSNADLRCGWLDTFLNTPGHHRAHHSVGAPGVHSNYGSFFNFADRIFGTRYLPEDQTGFDPIGLDDSYEVPTTFLKQLAVPFRWKQVSHGTGRPGAGASR